MIKKSLIKDSSGCYFKPELPIQQKNQDEVSEQLLDAKAKLENIRADFEALKVSYNTVKNDLEDTLNKNKSYQETISNLQETLKANIECEEKKCSKPVTEIQVVNKKSKNHVNVIENCDDIDLEIDTSDEDFDLNYNVKVSNIFSPLQVLGKESTVMLPTKDEALDEKTDTQVKFGSDLSRTAVAGASPRSSDSPSRTPSPTPGFSCTDSATKIGPTDCNSGILPLATPSSPFSSNLDHHFDRLYEIVKNYEKKKQKAET